MDEGWGQDEQRVGPGWAKDGARMDRGGARMDTGWSRMDKGQNQGLARSWFAAL